MEAVVNNGFSEAKIASVVDIYGLIILAAQRPEVLISPSRITKPGTLQPIQGAVMYTKPQPLGTLL